MKKTVYFTAAASVLLCIVFAFTYRASGIDALYSLAITFGTIAYHFLMRLAVGFSVDGIMKNKADYNSKWFRCSAFEEKIYRKLKVKQWKNRLPTFRPEYFELSEHSWDEIAQATCQSEAVHEIIVLLSFVPISFSVWFGALPVFIITSIFAALFDLLYVIIQRYNRPRIIRLIKNK